jgi:hypothetical protein
VGGPHRPAAEAGRPAAARSPGHGAGAATVRTTAAAVTVLAAALFLATACTSSGTGARDEGPAHTAPVGVGEAAASGSPSATASPAPRRVDPVKLVMTDPLVSPDVKRGLKRCTANGYPVDTSYGRLTGSGANDIVVNVLTCDSVSVGSYVYREDGTGYQNVFRDEEAPVYAEIDHGDLVVTQKVYERGDQLAYPSSEDVITYRWSTSDGRFAEQDRTHNDYSNAVGGDKPPGSES